MPVKIRSEKQIQEDIIRYKRIAQKLGDVGDIPGRRLKVNRPKRKAKGKKKGSYVAGGLERALAKKQVLQELKRKILSQKPSFRVNTNASDTTQKEYPSKKDTGRPKQSHGQGQNAQKLRTFDLKRKAITFEQSVTTGANYDDLINSVRLNADNIDFGLSWKILPKHLGKECQSFHIDYEADRVLAHQSGSFFGDDIDHYFRQLGQTFSETKSRNIPLI